VQEAVEATCKDIKRRVDVVVNYDAFEIEEPAMYAYAQVVEYMVKNYYANVTRYSTSSFLRDKLGQAIRSRGLASHIYETRTEAENAVS
jgi:propionate CoA-transferase